MKNNKIVIISLVLLAWFVSITYAWLRWTSNNTNVSFDINGMSVTYDGGANITSAKLLPTLDRTTAVTNGTAIEKTITASASKANTYMNLYLDINSIDTGLKHNTFKWEVVEGNTTLGSGNFASVNANDTVTLFSDEELTTSTSTYTLYIWIDGTEDNPEEMENKSFEFVLRADATDQTPPTAAEKIIQLAGNCTSWESGFSGVCATNAYDDNGVTKYHEYRYVGANVNNWVRFNNDDYRIIGVFDDNSHGQTGEWLVKLIAENPLGGYSWGVTNAAPEYTTYSEYNNNWETANANILLNEYWLNATDTSSTYKSCSDWTYYNSDNNYKTKDCSDIIGYGIQTANIRNYIQPVTWYLKGYNSYYYSKQRFYTCEKSDATTITNCTSGNSGAYATKVENKSVGLMYVSDYLYASGYYASTSTKTADNRYYGQQNWLYEGYECIITPNGSTSNYAFSVSGGSFLDNYGGSGYVYYPCALRPTFYLKSTIKIKSGDGTFASPFVIG